MLKLHAKKSPSKEQPREEIIQYLINYSRQLKVIKTNKNQHIELHLN